MATLEGMVYDALCYHGAASIATLAQTVERDHQVLPRRVHMMQTLRSLVAQGKAVERVVGPAIEFRLPDFKGDADGASTA